MSYGLFPFCCGSWDHVGLNYGLEPSFHSLRGMYFGLYIYIISRERILKTKNLEREGRTRMEKISYSKSLNLTRQSLTINKNMNENLKI